MKRTFGRRHAPDRRDASYRISARARRVEKHWPEGTWRPDQGDAPECCGYMGAMYLAGHPHRQYLDPRGIYQMAQRFDEWAPEAHEGSSVRAVAKVLAALGFLKEYRWATTLTAALAAIAAKGPLMMGTNWYRGMMTTDAAGYVEPTGAVVGGHAWLATGASTRRRRIRGWTSWREFGVEKPGRFYLSFDAFEALIQADGECCLPVERKAAPR
jgi:hypothetical protein